MLDGLLDDILAARRPMRLCAVGDLMAKLEGKDQEALEDVLANDAIRATEIRTVLAARGLIVPSESIRRHRRRHQGNGCGCP